MFLVHGKPYTLCLGLGGLSAAAGPGRHHFRGAGHLGGGLRREGGAARRRQGVLPQGDDISDPGRPGAVACGGRSTAPCRSALPSAAVPTRRSCPASSRTPPTTASLWTTRWTCGTASPPPPCRCSASPGLPNLGSFALLMGSFNRLRVHHCFPSTTNHFWTFDMSSACS